MPYRVNVGLNVPDPERPGEEIRLEEGAILPSLPAPWLLEQGCVSVVSDATTPDVSRVASPVAAAADVDDEERG